MPNSQASSTRGASVSWTSHSGITTLSSTWLVPGCRRRTTSRGSPGCGARSCAGRVSGSVSGSRSAPASAAVSCAVSGSRVISSALIARITAGMTGTHWITVVAVGGQGEPTDQRADGEADVERAAHEGQRAHPLLAGEDVERVRPTAAPPAVPNDLEHDDHGEELRRTPRATATRGTAPPRSARRPPRPAWARPGRRTGPAAPRTRTTTGPAMVRPRPTWAADSPTMWVKNTALPVRNAPSPIAKRIDWNDSRRASGARRQHPLDPGGHRRDCSKHD